MSLNQLLRSSVLAGICIGIAGFGYLASKDIIGAVLFAFGLLTVVHYALKLYTGTAGFIVKGEVGDLFLILLGNLVGCLIVALIARCSPMPLQETAEGILSARLATGPFKGGVLAIGWPLFITCGFPHCVADAFYYMCVPVPYLIDHAAEVLIFYVSIVIGNFIGCNLYRAIIK